MKKGVRTFDVIVIGAGSGLEISSYAAAQGLKVAVVEPGPFGGTCLNKGCIPSKMLIHSADVMETIKTARLFGIHVKVTKVDWKKLVSRVTNLVDSDAKNIEQGNKQAKNITLLRAKGVFVGKKLLKVGDETITAEKVFICAGARPSIPKIPGLDTVPFITSDHALRLKKQPTSMTIIGGGYISAELAHFYGTLGTKVTILQRGNLLMNNEDSEIAKKFTQVYRRKFNVILNANTKRVYKQGKNIVVDVATGGKQKKVVSEVLLVATGRTPNTDVLRVNDGGVETNERGFVKVNEFLQTSIPGVWAIGDIVGKYMFKHSANLEAAYAINNAFGKKVPVDYRAMPHAAFCSPQVAGVGLTEDELKEKKRKYLKNVYWFKDTGYGEAIQDNDGFVKVLADPRTGEILGCHIMGTDASVLIHEVIVAMKAGLGVDGITQAIHVHPALSEVVQRAFNF